MTQQKNILDPKKRYVSFAVAGALIGGIVMAVWSGRGVYDEIDLLKEGQLSQTELVNVMENTMKKELRTFKSEFILELDERYTRQ